MAVNLGNIGQLLVLRLCWPGVESLPGLHRREEVEERQEEGGEGPLGAGRTTCPRSI